MATALSPRSAGARPHALALSVRNLTGPVGSPMVRDVDIDLAHGATHLVLGPIHSGKSLLLRHLVGLERATSGTITIDGDEYRATGESEAVLREMRLRLGVIFEGSALFSRLTARENVELPLLEHTDVSTDEAEEAAQELLAEVGLPGAGDATPAQLGRLERRRVALARALALRPPVLLIDEPTHGLDSHSAHEFDESVARTQDARGFGLVIFSHEVRHAYGRVGQITVMAEGHVVARGTRDELQQSDHEVVRRFLNRRERRA